MGCAPSSQPVTARSWEVEREKPKQEKKGEPAEKRRSTVGKIHVVDKAEKTSGSGNVKEEETREVGDGMLGTSDKRRIDDILAGLENGKLYIDADFPRAPESLAAKDKKLKIRWKRPCELVKKPELLVDGISKSDIAQGSLGDCWFLSSCAAIAQKPNLMKRLVAGDQVLYGSKHKGLVHFRFWRFGDWVDVHIDNSLPSQNNKLIYARGKDPNEYWVALIEKAYAKLHGSYAAIEGGQSMDALVDLTGGLAERYELNEQDATEIYRKLAKAAQSGAFITCSRKGDWRSEHQETDDMGLIAGHAYTITDVKRIKRLQGIESLIRVRNPWGMGDEWKGAWSDKDHRWQLVDQETKDWLQYVDKEDGEFWMAFRDFKTEFQEVTICTLGPDFDGDGEADKAKQILHIHGRWSKGASAGGCRNDMRAFATNPQYLLTIYQPDDRDGSQLNEEPFDNTCSVVIGLMQEHRRSRRHEGVKMLQIGYIIYETNEPGTRLNADHFMYNYEIAKSGTYVNFREVCGRFDFEPGNYVIIPSTYNRDEEGTFLLRVFSSKEVGLKMLPSAEDSLHPPTVAEPMQNGHQQLSLEDDYDPEIDAAMKGHED